MLIAAYGVQYMPSQWSVLDEENKNLTMIKLKSAMPCSLVVNVEYLDSIWKCSFFSFFNLKLFFYVLNYFDVLILKIILKKIKIYYFYIFLYKK
jgi:hypothetical protein